MFFQVYHIMQHLDYGCYYPNGGRWQHIFSCYDISLRKKQCYSKYHCKIIITENVMTKIAFCVDCVHKTFVKKHKEAQRASCWNTWMNGRDFLFEEISCEISGYFEICFGKFSYFESKRTYISVSNNLSNTNHSCRNNSIFWRKCNFTLEDLGEFLC